ncbi:MAG: LysR family transcriptional regulator [Clostridiales Family XIII bacterium]|nr:LysR family transcriptional regulator [Clostridiales Family XIII bacterium]
MGSINIDWLKCYWTVISTGSFSLAAEKLYMSQSTVSKNVMALEKELGVPLLNRNGKYFTVSTSGRRLMKHFREILESHSHTMDAAEAIKAGKDRTGQIFRLSCVPTLAAYGVIAAIKHFVKLYPNIRIMTEEMEENRLLYMLEAKDCDIAFCSTIKLDRGLFDTQTYCKDCFMAAVSADSPLAGRSSVSMADLKGFKMILNRKESSLYDICMDACVGAGFEPNILFTTSRPDIACAYLFDSAYLYMGLSHVMKNFRHSDVRAIPIADSPTFEYCFAWHRNAELKQGAKKYLEFLNSRGNFYFEQSKPMTTVCN